MTISLAAEIYKRAHLEGRFRLRSGASSTEYFDKYRFESDPLLLRQIAEQLCDLLPTDAEALAGLELGGIPIATIMSQLSGLPVLFVRKEPKSYGTRQLAEGGDVVGRHLVIVEDVVTSGGQIIDSCQRLRALGATVGTAICVIDREAGGVENLVTESVELRSLLTMSELQPDARPTS
jgi:orotate phosphoribosyltransferase